MISLTRLRALDLADSGATPRHLSAASGLARRGDFLYVVADDELHLGIFPATDRTPGRLLRLFPGELPQAKADRKRHKPDLEAIAELPAFADHPYGALLALGSGSENNRRRGAVVVLDGDGAAAGVSRVADFAPLFAALDRHFPALNIEGAVVDGGELRLLQRATRRHPLNAIVRYSLPPLIAALASGAPVGNMSPSAIDRVDLGAIDGVPLSFTDGASLPGGAMVFTAVAEDTEDTYNDGACLGAAIGIVANDGSLRLLERIEGIQKVEGVTARLDGDAIRLLLVTDADDPAVPANLFAATIANPPP